MHEWRPTSGARALTNDPEDEARKAVEKKNSPPLSPLQAGFPKFFLNPGVFPPGGSPEPKKPKPLKTFFLEGVLVVPKS